MSLETFAPRPESKSPHPERFAQYIANSSSARREQRQPAAMVDVSSCSLPNLEIDIPMTSDACRPVSDSVRRLYDTSESGVVQIRRNGVNDATGFVFDGGEGNIKIGTAAHVVGQAKPDGVEIIAADGKVFRTRVEKVDIQNDLAILSVEGATGSSLKPLTLAAGDANTGDSILVLGHPEAHPRIFASPGEITDFESRTEPIEKGQSKAPPATTTDRANGTYFIESSGKIHIEGGDSGAPALNDRGEIIGVAHAGSKNSAEIVPISNLRKLNARTDDAVKPKISNDGTIKGW